MKFFPVALAALAFVSCSDELTDNQAKNVGKFDNALYFTMESTSDATRAGIVGNATDNLNDVRFRWTKNDQVRVYDENLAMYDVYQYGGESFVENTPASAFTNPAPWATKKLTTFSVGVYPNSAVEAVYLDKTDREKKHIVMNVPANYTFEAATVGEGDAAKEAYRCDVPMYGNINDVTTGVTEMNFLTAWTRIYTRNIPADIQYICVVSEKATQPLTGQFEAQVHYPLAATDEPWLQKKDNVEETWGNIMYSDISRTPAEFREKGGICFPLLVQTYDNIHIYALKAGAGKTFAELDPAKSPLTAMTDWATLITNGQAIEIASKENLQITRRRQCWTVRYTYNYYLDTDPVDQFRPGEVSKVLAAQAANIIGDFKVIPYSAADGLTPVHPTMAKTLVSGEGDYYTHRIEIPQISPLANIVLDFSGAGIQYDEALQIYDKNPETNQFSGKLTIIPGKIQGGSAKAKIEVNLPLATVYIVGDGTNPIGNVDIQSAKEVHIGDGITATTQDATRTTVFKGGKLFIEDKASIAKVYAQAYAGDPSKHAVELIVEPGGYITNEAFIQTQCNVTLNGAGYDAAAQKLYTGVQNDGMAQIINLDCSAVKAPVTITSQGDARIAEIIAPTEPKHKLNYLTIKSKMFQKSATDKAPTQGRVVGAFNGKNAIFTASQLTKYADTPLSGATYVVADEIDMNNVEWTAGDIKADFYSINYNTSTHKMNDLTKDAEKEVSTATGLTEIKNLKLKDIDNPNGLFATMTNSASIAGLKITNVDFTKNDMTANKVRKFGALVGNVTAAATIDEVTVTGLTFSSKGASALGGLIGLTSANVTINDASVSTSETGLKGRSFVGGLIGEVTGTPTIAISDSKTPTLAFELALRDGTSLQSTQVGTFGSFIGGADGAATINIYDCNFGKAISKELKGNGVSNVALRFGAVGNSDDEPFFGGNAWIGRFTGGAGNLISYVSTNDNKTNYKQFTYSSTSMTMRVYTGGSGAFVGGSTPTGVGNVIVYDGTAATTANPNEGYQYGVDIYSAYSATKLGYDNTYKDAK